MLVQLVQLVPKSYVVPKSSILRLPENPKLRDELEKLLKYGKGHIALVVTMETFLGFNENSSCAMPRKEELKIPG